MRIETDPRSLPVWQMKQNIQRICCVKSASLWRLPLRYRDDLVSGTVVVSSLYLVIDGNLPLSLQVQAVKLIYCPIYETHKSDIR